MNPDLVVRDEKGEIYTVRYEAVNAMLLNEFLKEHRTRSKAQHKRDRCLNGTVERAGVTDSKSERQGGTEQTCAANGRRRSIKTAAV